MGGVGIFYSHLVYFTGIWSVFGHLVYFAPIWNIFRVLVCCYNKNLATLEELTWTIFAPAAFCSPTSKHVSLSAGCPTTVPGGGISRKVGVFVMQ
jgi:hypothetical protein